MVFCLIFSVFGALVLSVRRVSISVRIFLPSILPSHLVPLVLSPLPLVSSPLFVRFPLLCLPLLRWLLSPALLLPAHPFSAPSTVSVASSLPSRVSTVDVSGCLRWVLLRWWLRLLQDFLFFCSLCSSICNSSCGSSFFSYLLPGLWVSRGFSLAFGSLSVACLFRACPWLFSGGAGIPWLPSGPPTSLLHPFSCLCLRCCPLPQLSLCFALLLRAPLRVPLALPLLPRFPLLALVTSLLSLVLLLSFLRCLGLLRLLPSSSLCLVTVLLSLCSSFVGPDAPGAAAPAPEALVPPPLTASARAGVRILYWYLVALLPQAAGSSQAPLPPCSLVVEFLLLLLLVVLSFCLGLSVCAPRFHWLPLAVFLCWLVVFRGPPFCLLVGLRVLLGAVLLGFCGSGYSFMAGKVWGPLLGL